MQSDLLGPSQYTIANIHGIGGVGKTTLKAEVLIRLQEAGAMIPLFHADENIARSDLAEFIGALAESFHQPWDGEPAAFARVRRARHRLRELKGRLARERDAEILDRGLKVAVSGLARRALLAKRPPDQPAHDPGIGGTRPAAPILTATVPASRLAPEAGKLPALPGRPDGDLRNGPAAATSVAIGQTVQAPAGFTFQAPTDDWTKADQQAYEQAVAAWTRDREDQELLLDPLATLTRGLYDDLTDFLFPQAGGLLDLLGAKRNLAAAPFRVLLAIDSYEALDSGIHEWLLAHVLPTRRKLHAETGKRYEELVDLRLLLSGREALRDADPLRRWDGLAAQIREVDLDRFDAREVAGYLEARGADPELAPRALAETQGLPYLLALWCDSTGSHRAVAVARAANRIYWWKTPAQVRWLKAAAFLEMLDRDRLAVVLADAEEAHDAYTWLSSNGEVAGQASGGGLALHPILRELVRAGLAQESPAELAELERRAEVAREAAALRLRLGPAAFAQIQTLSPLRWFDAALLEELFPADADALWRLADRLARQDDLVEAAPEPPDAWCLGRQARDLLIDYQRLAYPARFNEATAALHQAARLRAQGEYARCQALTGSAESRRSDAAVARQRALAHEARVASLQAEEHAAEDALKRSELALPDPDAVSRRAPWWAGAASALIAALAAFGSMPMLEQAQRLYGWGTGSALLVLALACATRALWLPRPPSERQIDAARQAVDEAVVRLARVRGELAQALLELSAAARLADQLQAEADETLAQAQHTLPAFI